MYKVIFKHSAIKELRRLPRSVIARVDRYVQQLKQTPFLINSTKLQGYNNLYRLRIGDYRLIYLVEQTIRVIKVTKVAHRREVYRS